MSAIDLEIIGDTISKFLKEMDSRVKKIAKADKQLGAAIGVYVFQDVMDHFKDEKGEDGAWPAWSKVYQDHMERIGRAGNRKLQFSGRLRNNFKPSMFRRKDDYFEWYNDAKVKSGYPYAKGHDEGDGKLPKRSFMWISSKAMEKVAHVTLQFALGGKL